MLNIEFVPIIVYAADSQEPAADLGEGGAAEAIPHFRVFSAKREAELFSRIRECSALLGHRILAQEHPGQYESIVRDHLNEASTIGAQAYLSALNSEIFDIAVREIPKISFLKRFSVNQP